MSYVSSVNNLVLVEEPIAAEFVGRLQQQPSLMAVDEQVVECHMNQIPTPEPRNGTGPWVISYSENVSPSCFLLK